ncbi:HvfC/BufC N-terminal domain-containing protein [Duganella alba]|nr:DNA-binding domain-containing protein [Duganella alba]
MRRADPGLLALQVAVSKALHAADDGEACQYVRADGVAAAERLQLYRNSVRQTLVRALQLTYPAVARLVGDAFFTRCAQDQVAACPDDCAWLERYGASFGDFLAADPAAASVAYLADVARLEFLVNCARYADDVRPADFTALQAVPEACAGGLRFRPHPALGLLHAAAPVDAIRAAVLYGDDAALQALDPHAGPVWLLVSRGADGVDVRRLPEPAWRMVAALCGGARLDEAARWAPDDVSGLLATHLVLQDFIDFSFDTGAAPCNT